MVKEESKPDDKKKKKKIRKEGRRAKKALPPPPSGCAPPVLRPAAVATYANDYFNRLCAAARRDGRALDPLFCDLANLKENDNDADDAGDDGDEQNDQNNNNNNNNQTSTATPTPTEKNKNKKNGLNKEDIINGSAYYTTRISITDTNASNCQEEEEDHPTDDATNKHNNTISTGLYHQWFRLEFPTFDVQTVSKESLLLDSRNNNNNNEGASCWNSLLQRVNNNKKNNKAAAAQQQKENNDDSYDNNNSMQEPTFLRKDYLDMYWMEDDDDDYGVNSPKNINDLLIVPRYQFLFIEATRIKEGIYNRSFRRVLEVFDLKTQADRLENSLKKLMKEEEEEEDPLLLSSPPHLPPPPSPSSSEESPQSESQQKQRALVVDDDANKKKALDAIRLLTIQWPTPSNSALKTTQVVSILQRGSEKTACSIPQEVRIACQQLMDHWKSLKSLEEISSVLKLGGGEDYQRLQPSLTKAGEALISLDNSSFNSSQVGGGGGGYDDEKTTTKTVATTIIKSTEKERQQEEELLINNEKKKDPPSIQALTFGAHPNPERTTEVFRELGFVVLSDKKLSLHECALHAREAFDALVEEQLEPRGIRPLNGDGDDIRFELPMARTLKARRVDNQYKILDGPNLPLSILGQHLQQEIPLLICHNEENNFELNSAGVIHCLPKRPNQKKEGVVLEAETWHSDGTTLFSNTHHDAHSFTVYIPLTDMQDSNATMEFVPGTHVDAFYHEVAPGIAELAEQDSTAQHELAVRANVAGGTMLIFDSRLWYRGLPNDSKEERQILYFTFARTWFQKPEEGRQKSFRREIDVHSKLLVVSRLYQLVSGMPDTQLVSASEPIGHPFYTNRFDLLLIDGLVSEDHHLRSTAMTNIAAIIHFSRLTEGDKETMSRQFYYNLSSERSYDRRARVLRKARGKRQKDTKEDEIEQVAIYPNNALTDLTTSLLLEESTLLAKLGFASDINGLAVMLAMLKAHASRRPLGCIGITEGRLEESFTLWWHARNGRFNFILNGSDDKSPSSSILVIFSDMDLKYDHRDWSDAIRNARDEKIDILHVLDPSFSCFCQDPEGDWKGGEYFCQQLEDRLSNYESVMFLGDMKGASAALRFSRLAHRAVVFSPHIDLPSCKSIKLTRPDFPTSIKAEFRDKLLEELKSSDANVTIHYAELCREHCEQVKLLPTKTGIELVGHGYNDTNLLSYLESSDVLGAIIRRAIYDFATPKTARSAQ